MSRNECLHAASDRSADMLYATGMSFTDPVFWFRKGSRTYLLASPLEIGRARRQARVTHVVDQALWRRRLERRTEPLTGRRPDLVEIGTAVLQDKGVDAVEVPEDFPVRTADALRAAGVAVTWRRAPFFVERMHKRPDELAGIRAAQAATERSLERALTILREATVRGGWLRWGGERVTAELLRREIHVSLLADGCIGRHTIVAVGDQCVDPHDIGSGPVRSGQPIIFDIFPRHTESGYFADMTRTVVRGKPSKRLREIYAAVEAGQQYAFDRIHADCDAEAIHHGIRALFDETGFPTGPVNGRNQGFFHGTGHGVGLDIHEPPSFGPRPSRLPEGAVVTVEPGLYYEHVGGVRLEDMVLVTKDGCENLTGFRKSLTLDVE